MVYSLSQRKNKMSIACQEQLGQALVPQVLTQTHLAVVSAPIIRTLLYKRRPTLACYDSQVHIRPYIVLTTCTCVWTR